jgi:hypothetical protein
MDALWHSSAILRPAYELLFSFSTPGNKDQFLDLVRSNVDMGSDYIENDFMSPTTEEIRNARPLVAVLPEDIVSRATLIASALCAGTEGDPEGVVGGSFVRLGETASAVTVQRFRVLSTT